MAGIQDIIAQRQLERAVMGLELTFAECAGLVVYDPDEKTASYRVDASGAEAIHVGPLVAQLDVPCIEMVLRHEILHRSLYNGFGEQHHHQETSNLALDVCINRLLYEAYPDAMRKTAKAIYPAESKVTPIALADPSADPVRLPTELGELWQQIWTKTAQGYLPLNPASLYFRLMRLLDVGLLSTFVPFCKMGHGLPAKPDARGTMLAGRVARAVSRRLPRGSDLGQSLQPYSVVPVPIGTDEVDAFLAKMAVRKVVDATAAKVLAPLAREIRLQAYPAFPSRVGLVWQISGVSEALGLYKNREIGNAGARMSVGLYLDVSGSMIPYFPMVASFASALKEVPLKLRIFDTSVRDVPIEELSKGKIIGGGGTDFDAPIRDLLADRDIEAAVLFTDGDADVTPPVARALRASKKRLYVVYFRDRGGVFRSPLDQLARDTMTVPAAALAK
ncbi:MAG: hypothetical protein KF819_02020 [Labilithrix sp.]|nr:hypothetical protein [Labilithrix sp.]